MNRTLGCLALVAAMLGLVACGGQKAPAEASTEAGEMKGRLGVYYVVSVSRPVGGTIRSSDGRINCGTLSGPDQLCAPVSFAWTARAELTAIPDAGQYFQSWAADCSDPTDSCTLDTTINAADKWVVAVFNPPERLGHGNITAPSLHAPKYFAFLGNDAGAPRCTNCHGQNYAGQANAPSCNACHAAAGWADWQQSCSFCHGTRNATTMAGYDFAIHPEWAAPPDDVNGRLTGLNGAAVGAHQKHVAALPGSIRSPIACSECHDPIPATAIHYLNHSLDLPFGPLSRSQGAVPQWDAATLTCSANYCHGNFTYGSVQGKAASLSWGGSLTGCTTCHDMPPAGHAYSTNPDPASCATCHPDTVTSTGTIDLAKGRHINGEKDAAGGACDSCHWFPDSATRLPTGAHLAHYGLTAADGGGSGYGDLQVLEDRFAAATPTDAPSKYAFGCGNCHPMDTAQHSMGSGSTVAKVFLHEAGAPAGTLKSLNAPTASFDATAKTCSGVYCHSSGQASPSYATTPAWNSGTSVGCSGCHANPPKYASGGAGSATANTHVVVADDGWALGHFAGFHGPWGSSSHGRNDTFGNDAAPITCQTCHFDTVDPSNTGPTGFYYLDTTGNYEVYYTPTSPVGAPPTLATLNDACQNCHTGVAGGAPTGTGRALPLRHVNGTRDVVFDARSLPGPIVGYPGAPASPNLQPYWYSNLYYGAPASLYNGAVFESGSWSVHLKNASYDPTTKTCTNVACHLQESNTAFPTLAPLRWGTTPVGYATCDKCHGYGSP